MCSLKKLYISVKTYIKLMSERDIVTFLAVTPTPKLACSPSYIGLASRSGMQIDGKGN